ncbi:hypothetical protein CAOG_01451 [Capsaspora owczarzaki ATCC 30864]|uniref:Neutral ceramidase n=1 Tax=Capsaspora owczarzaki (strain ATCC 30864) TaxID=595528 RepID=A0A0D2U4K6_CAPO3|nr:hypothetical protein CAOG_01451 [Capsaspora owczarzaki ATCC 30864]KJE90076.1 hypothetical protein CAOG_001451 [Capsaspora owczarzaki ATCC 30864]|eukprot:XP_004364319.1 hypothetical protein CAOG_01451 [Capsaspora owczarzaki ATCC 30864]
MTRTAAALLLVLACATAAALANPLHDAFSAPAGSVRAGVSKVDATMPIGVPLGGYNHGERRVPNWPLPIRTNYTYWMTPSVGHLDPTWAKALVIDDGNTKFCFATIDAIGSEGDLRKMAYDNAVSRGFTVPYGQFILSASHTHSGPAGISSSFLFEAAPAMDLKVAALQELMASHIADALVQAEQNLAPAQFGIGVGQLVGVTRNRRANISPYVTPTSIDPNLGVVRVDDQNGKPIATVFNYAMHGTCYGPSNMNSSGDIPGASCNAVEQAIGGVALFVNADAGDIDPTGESCQNFAGAVTIAQAVKSTRDSIVTATNITIAAAYAEVNFGDTDMNITLARFENCTSGGELDICTICAVIGCEYNAHLGPFYIETVPAFAGVRFTVNNVHTLLATLPGEPLLELGWQVRNDSAALGFDQMILAGYTNNHMGYFCTPNEYVIGGYESQLTLWGIDTAEKIRASVKQVAAQVAP